MLQKLTILSALSGLVLLSSCGTNKKLEAANAQIDQLKSQNTQLNTTINGLQKQVNDLTASNKSMADEYASYKANFENYKTQCEAAQAKLKAVNDYLNDQYNTLQNVEKKIETALANFENKGVEVYYKDGLVYVEMEENLLYKSGSAALGEKGKKALASLSSVLNDYPKLKVIVVGNTDNVKFKSGSNNWSLSTERANGVVYVLEHVYNVDPTRLTSAGKGKYNPVADNSTAEGRAKNRRTDIILNPDLERLWESAQQGQ